MFFASADRIRAMRELIGAAELAREGEEEDKAGGGEEDGEETSAANAAARAARAAAGASALSRLKAYQREDFAGIFREMRGRPVVVRTLDPPLHEFLPAEGPALDELVESLSKLLAVSREVREERGLHDGALAGVWKTHQRKGRGERGARAEFFSSGKKNARRKIRRAFCFKKVQ